MNTAANARVGAASADVAGEGGIDVGIGGLGVGGEEGDGRHDLTGLAVTALRHVFIDPGLLNGVASVVGSGYAFDGGDGLVGDVGDGGDARPDGFAVEVDGAGAAETHAATEFGAGKFGAFANHPQQGHRGIDVERLGLVVESKIDGHGEKGRGRLRTKTSELGNLRR